MDQIADQLRAEIESLADYIQRTEERLQVSGWVSEMLDPFEELADDLSPGDLRRVVSALQQARYHFEVNGDLSGRIDSILERHVDLLDTPLPSAEAHSSVESMPARDPAYADLRAEDLSADEEEELQEPDPPRVANAFQAIDFSADEQASDLDALFSSASPHGETEGTDAGASMDTPASASSESFSVPTVDAWEEQSNGDHRAPEGSTASVDELFAAPRDDEDSQASADAPSGAESDAASENAEVSASDLYPGSLDALFAEDSPAPPPRPAQRKPSVIREHETGTGFDDSAPEPGVDLFAHKVSIEDVLLRLDVALPSQDKARLQDLLRNRLEDRVLAALRTNAAFEKRFILIPRLSRFIHEGQLFPCTIKNLARTFIALFGDIRDLMRYRDQRFLDTEVPEQGWALITAEAPRESLDKTFMEQTQYLRFLAASVGIASHLVRRRTLVEAVYDCVVGRMVLGNTLQVHTLDWTSTKVGRNDYVGIYVADSGIRLRDLPRTTHNRALGTVPNW